VGSVISRVEMFGIVVTFHFAALLEVQLHFQLEEQANHGNNYQLFFKILKKKFS
jgi:hypothetical protein